VPFVGAARSVGPAPGTPRLLDGTRDALGRVDRADALDLRAVLRLAEKPRLGGELDKLMLDQVAPDASGVANQERAVGRTKALGELGHRPSRSPFVATRGIDGARGGGRRAWRRNSRAARARAFPP
jgi:hypothetical protein